MIDNSKHNQALYRYFDSDNQLLYVGISSNFYNRTNAHLAQSKWVQEAALVTIEWFESREKVEQAEKIAIQNERPMYNKIHGVLPLVSHLETVITSDLADDFHKKLKERIRDSLKQNYSLLSDEISLETLSIWSFLNAIYEIVDDSEFPRVDCKLCQKLIESDFANEVHAKVCDHYTGSSIK